MISRKGNYAIRALLFLARSHGRHHPVSVDEIATCEGIPRKFLETIMQELKKAGILQSRRGKTGGYTFRQSPQELTVGKIVRVIDGPPVPIYCSYERCGDCPSEGTCRVRLLLEEVRTAVNRTLDLKTLEQLIRESQGVPGAPTYDI